MLCSPTKLPEFNQIGTIGKLWLGLLDLIETLTYFGRCGLLVGYDYFQQR